MREIKFRGMSINGQWFIGDLARPANDISSNVKAGQSFISNAYGMSHAYPVRPETVGQFTGLLDKNGVEIYEGDIVLQPVGFGMTDDRDLVGEVRMLDASWCSVISIRDGMTFVVYFYEYTKPSEFIVIGNIYEHPDLLDKKGE